MKAAFLACLLAGVAAAQSQAPKGSISGRVVSRPNGEPIRGAFVIAVREMQERGIAWTGQDGRFRIENLAEGRYSIVAGKPSAGTKNRYVDVRAGEETPGVELQMAPGARVLAGRVRDRNGLPVEGTTVSLQGVYWQNGRPHAGQRQRAVTDDRGEFRVSPMSSLPYFVTLQPPPRPEIAGRLRLLHPPAFYPNALNPAEAQPVRAERGTKLEGIDFEVPTAADTRLRVTASAAKRGEPRRSCVRCDFSLSARNSQVWLEVLRGRTDSGGAIEIRGLHPGNYRLAVATETGGLTYAGYTDVIVEAGQVRLQEVTAWAANPTPVEVTLVEPPEDLREWTVRIGRGLLDIHYPIEIDAGTAVIEGSGRTATGQLALVPGEWTLHLTYIGGGDSFLHGYIEQVLAGGRPQSSPSVTVTREGFAPRLELRIGFHSATLTGKVGGLPAFNPAIHGLLPQVLLIPEPGQGYAQRIDGLILRNGEFSVENVAPGGYVVFATPPGEPEPRFDFADPAVQARYANYGKRVTLVPGETVRVELQAIP